MRAAVSWVTTRARWLAEPRLFWLTVIVSVGAIYFATRAGATELHVRAISAGLQLLGVANVAWGIRETRKLFSRRGVVDWTRDWWGRRPTGSKRIGVLAGAIHLGGMTATATLSAHIDRSKTASLDERVDRLEKDFDILRDQLTQTRDEFKQTTKEHRKKLEDEARVREAADAANRKLVESTQTGGLALSAAGAVWLVVGIVLGSFPEEIAGCCGW